ncbi:hypothetical protein BV20DRAFT_1113456 [Pilatotrama ljubarskyi]|nr:hypothetical protein BV20DRAFT_1113456 [Pilatotrama ljubarskyi]
MYAASLVRAIACDSDLELRCILYGVELLVYSSAVRTMSHRPSQVRDAHTSTPPLGRVRVLSALSLSLTVSTLAICIGTVFDAMSDGPVASLVLGWYAVFSAALSLSLDALACGLLVYRCWAVWEDARVVALVGLLYLGAYADALRVAGLCAAPDGLPGKYAHVQMPAHASGILGLGRAACTWLRPLDVLVTALLCARTLYVARRRPESASEDRLEKCGGDEFSPDEAEPVESAGSDWEGDGALVVVECALLYTLLGGACLATSMIDGETSLLCLSVYLLTRCIVHGHCNTGCVVPRKLLAVIGLRELGRELEKSASVKCYYLHPHS